MRIPNIDNDPAHGQQLRAFLSRTSEFFEYPPRNSYINLAVDACNSAGYQAVDMSHWTASPNPPIEECRQTVSVCDVYIGVIGYSFGSPIGENISLSYTEAELETARAAKKDIFIFMLAPDGDMPPGLAIGDADYAPIQKAFRARLNREFTVTYFTHPQELRRKISEALQEHRGSWRKSPYSVFTAPYMAPDLPSEFFHRPDEFSQMCEAAAAAARRAARGASPRELTIGFAGAGGFGKTALVSRVCDKVKDLFPEGVLFVSFSERPSDRELIDHCRTLAQVYDTNVPNFISPIDAGDYLGRVLGQRRILLVLDGVSQSFHLEPFMRRAKSTVRLVTTRDPAVLPDGASIVTIKQLSFEQSLRVLAWQIPPSDVRWQDLVLLVGGSPLLASLINADIRAESETDQDAKAAVLSLKHELRKHGVDLDQFNAKSDPTSAIIETVLRRFGQRHGPDPLEWYRFLAVFPTTTPIPLEVVSRSWTISDIDVDNFVQRLVNAQLIASYDPASHCIRLHDVIRSHLLGQIDIGVLQSFHARIADAHRPADGVWGALPRESEYLWRSITMHLREGGLLDEHLRTVSDHSFLASKIGMLGPTSVVDDLAAAVGWSDQNRLYLAVHGVEGTGKSSFLTQVRRRVRASSVSGTTVVSVSLDSNDSMAAVSGLLEMRNQVGFDCPLFDTTLLTLWAALRQPRQAIERDEYRGTAYKVLARVEAADEFMNPSLPATFASMVYTGLRNSTSQNQYYRAEFDQIDLRRGHTSALRNLLPHLLGLDIARHTNLEDSRWLFLYDNYSEAEQAENKTDRPWLSVFIRSVNTGVHLIASRSPVHWPQGPGSICVQNIGLDRLPDFECRSIIRRELKRTELELEDVLLELALGNPLYLRILLGSCELALRRNGSVDAAALPTTRSEIVQRYLQDIPNARQAILLLLVQYFDKPLFDSLTLSIPSLGGKNGVTQDNVSSILEFVRSFYVERVGDGFYRTDGVLTNAVRGSRDQSELKNRGLSNATDHLFESTAKSPGRRGPRLSRFFDSVVLAWQWIDFVPITEVEKLVDVGYNLFDAGYWPHLTDLTVRDSVERDHPARVVAEYFAALTSSMRVGTGEGLIRLEALGGFFRCLGRHSSSGNIEIAYLRELGGDYQAARMTFSALSNSAKPFNPLWRDHVRANLYYGDILTTDGLFIEASDLLRQTYEDVGPGRSLDWVELVRHRGHAHRFSFDLKSAENLYTQALAQAGGAPNARVKLMTNLAETRCWFNPSEGVHDADRAISLNRNLGNRIEVVKAEAARGIALALLGDFEQAREGCSRAFELAEEVDYPAGRCFAGQALVVVESQAGCTSAAEAAYGRLSIDIDGLGTYGHLLVVAAWFIGDRSEFLRHSALTQWINPDHLEDCLYDLVIAS